MIIVQSVEAHTRMVLLNIILDWHTLIYFCESHLIIKKIISPKNYYAN